MKHRPLASLMLACCTAGASAQSLQPQFYMWSPAPWGWSEHQMIPILNANKDLPSSDPEEVAADLAATIQAYFDDGYPMDKIAILIFNLGQWQDPAVSLIDHLDAITPAPTWDPNSVPPPGSSLPFQQPWMTHGRLKVKTWMEEFLVAYSARTYNNGTANVPLPVPARFHFDSEVSISTCCDVNYTRILRAVALDNRWGTTPVPGFGTSTMADLYDAAQGLYNWPDVPITFALDPDFGPTDDANKHYFIWYWDVCERALDAAMNELAYEVIRDHFDQAATIPLISNYADVDTNGQPATFGWFSVPNYSNPTWPFGVVPEREWFNGSIVSGGSGAQYLLVDPYTSGNKLNWSTASGTVSGDLSSPVLYTYVFGDSLYPPGEHPSVFTHRGYNYYLPGWSTEASSSWESVWDTALRN